MPVPTADGVQVTVTMLQANGDVCVNVFHFSGPSLEFPVRDDFEDFADFVKNAWDVNLRGGQSDQDTLVNIRVADMTTAPYFVFSKDYSVAGGSSTNQLPKQVALCGSLHTAHAGRRGRGRVFAGCLTTAAITSTGSAATAIRTSLSGYLAALVAGFTGTNGPWVLSVFSRSDVALYPVTSVTIDTRMDVQRRRANRRVA